MTLIFEISLPWQWAPRIEQMPYGWRFLWLCLGAGAVRRGFIPFMAAYSAWTIKKMIDETEEKSITFTLVD